MKVLVIGTGWFGCEVAAQLERMRLDFDMVDQSNRFFAGSSSRNQNRLHLGFHYCRSSSTREECRQGYDVFTSTYPDLSEAVTSYYIVARNSLLDFKTYTAIFDHDGTPYEVKSTGDLREDGVHLDPKFVDGEHVLVVRERWINFQRAGKHFADKFAHRLLHFDPKQLSISGDNRSVSYGPQQYGAVFDCSYGQLLPLPASLYEVCLTLVYRKRVQSRDKPPIGVTVVDGPFYSLYPYVPGDDLFTLTHVTHTPMFSSTSMQQVDEYSRGIGVSDVNRRKDTIERDVCASYANFLGEFEYHSYFLSTKTKFTDSGFADRSVRVERRGRITSLCGGKITGALDIVEVVKQSLEETTIGASESVVSSGSGS